MKSLLLLSLFLPLFAQGTTLSWRAASENDTGYKIYWAMTDVCQTSSESDFIYSVDVGPVLEYNFSQDPNFQTGKKYMMRLVTYNREGQESEQSPEVLCVQIEAPEPPQEIKKK